MTTAARKPGKRARSRRGWAGRLLRGLLLAVAAFYGACLTGLVALRWIHPPTTAVQTERRLSAWLHGRPYQKRYVYVPLSRISLALQRAVMAAEDGRFYQHHGFDWEEMRKVMDRDLERKRLGRGASTITQQLVKNLFLSTRRSLVRKAVEATLVPPAEWILGKRRILELYLNVIEWGPGVYGAEAAARFYYREPAARLDREQAARLAAVIPAPLTRTPRKLGTGYVIPIYYAARLKGHRRYRSGGTKRRLARALAERSRNSSKSAS